MKIKKRTKKGAIAKELDGLGAEVYEGGDGKQVANILNAIWDAYEVARNI